MPDVSILGDMVKTTTIPATVKHELVGQIDGIGPGQSLLSVSPHTDMPSKYIHLVVGAEYKHKYQATFNRHTLGQLIKQLEAIHSLMKH